MTKGHVYIITNEAMPGLVKIGRTARTVEHRVGELNTTGVPFPFEVYAEFATPNCIELERWVHSQLANCRVNEQREFFVCDPSKARSIVENLHKEQIIGLVDEYLPDHTIERSDMIVDTSITMIMATYFDLNNIEMIDSYQFMTPEDVAPAVQRMRDHYTGKKKMDWVQPAETEGGI